MAAQKVVREDDAKLQERRRERGRRELTDEDLRRREIALRHVRQFGDPVLRTASRPVERFDDGLRGEVDRMRQIMQDTIGIGLAANQIGLLQRVFVFRIEEEGPIEAMINPEFVWRSEETEIDVEACLSIPEVSIPVERAVAVRVHAYDEFGNQREIEAQGLEARCLQHESDHLDGVLTIDRATQEERKQAMRILREISTDHLE